MRLHSELQGIKGTQLDARMQERVACTITTTRVLTIATSLRSVRFFKTVDVAPAIRIVFANLAEGRARNCVQLERLRAGTYYDPHPPQNKPAKIKFEFAGQEGDEPTTDMLAKQLQVSGCTMTEAWRLGEQGRCECPKHPQKLNTKVPPSRYLSIAYTGTVQQITQEFLRLMEDEGRIGLPSGKFRVAPLPPTGEFLVHLIVSAGEPDSLSGNLRAMTEMGLSQLEIEMGLGRVVGKALEHAGTSADILNKYNGVLISSEVRRLERQGGRFLYMHPRDPLLRPRAEMVSFMTAPGALGSPESKFGSPKLFLILASVEAARRARTEIQEIRLQLPIGQGVSMTPAPEESSIAVGLAEALSKLQQQVNTTTAEPLTWIQETHKSMISLSLHWNVIANQRLIAEMEAGRGLIVRAHPEVGRQLITFFQQYDNDREYARAEPEWKALWQNMSNLLQVTEGRVSAIKMEVVHATIWLKNVSMRQLLHAGGVFDPSSQMSALMTNVETALQVRPVGLQYCVTSSKGVRKIQGLNGEAPFLYARLWAPHIENLRQTLTFRDNRSSFVFLSLTGQEIQAQIRLFAETGQDVGVPTDITQTMEMLLEAFDRGIALFMPTVTAEGTAITTNTRVSDLQPLTEDQQKECPFDIRAWNVAAGFPEQRLQALQTLIQNNKVSMVVSANNEQQDWTVYMAIAYAKAINSCVDEKLFAWDEVQLGEDISDRVTTALQITFVNLLNEHALSGIYCSRDLVMQAYQGMGTGDDGSMLSDAELALMPRSLWELGRWHPFVSTNKGTMATQTLVDMIKDGNIKVVGKAGAGVIITEPLNGLVSTIRQCATTIMSPMMTTKWAEIQMTEHDLTMLTEKAVEKLLGTNFVWLFADPGQMGMAPIHSLGMQDQTRECTAQTVCKLDRHDARFSVGNWIFPVLHTLVDKGTLVAQAVVHRKQQRSGWIIVSPDKDSTLPDQYGDLPTIATKLKSVQLGDDDKARERLLELELERLDQHLDREDKNVILVLGAEKSGQSFVFLAEMPRGEFQADINVLTRGLARKTKDHQQATIHHALYRGKIVLQVGNGVLLVPPGHVLTTWSQDDARLKGWHPSMSLEELVQSARAMDQDQEHEERPSTGLEMAPAEVAPAEGGGFKMQIMRAIATMGEVKSSQVLIPARVESNTSFGKLQVGNAFMDNGEEWSAGLDYADPCGAIWILVTLDQEVTVTGIGTLPRQSPATKIFTRMQVQTPDTEMPENRLLIPEDRRLHIAQLPQSITSKAIRIVFDKKAVIGDGDPPGFRGMVLLGRPPEVATASQGVLAMMKRAATVTEQTAAGHMIPIVKVTATSCLGDAFCADNVCKDDNTEWAVTNANTSEKGAICLTVTLAREMRVAAVALMHRDSQESRETKVFTAMYVQTPELRMPGNLMTIPQDRELHEFLLPKPFVGEVIQLAFDKKKVAGTGEPPGLRGLLVYGHEPDAEIDAQGGRDGHKKVRQ